MKREHLPPTRKYNHYLPHFSVAEVFESGHMEFVYLEAIKNKCSVLSKEEYEELSGSSENIYFCRAQFDPTTTTIIPDPKTWPSECICRMPVNPDLEYIQCAKCDKWMHLHCVKRIRAKISDVDFICSFCKNHSK